MEGDPEEEFDGDDLFRRYRSSFAYHREPTQRSRAAAAGRESSTTAADEPIDGASLAARPAGGSARDLVAECAAVFNNQHTHTNAYSELLEEAEFFESWIQGFRRRSWAPGGRMRLHELFGNEHEVLYCADDVHSQQNRCLLSGRYLDAQAGQ